MPFQNNYHNYEINPKTLLTNLKYSKSSYYLNFKLFSKTKNDKKIKK